MSLLLSIVTVSLNAATTIDDTLASVALQAVGFEFEHICVDGGSTDSTRAIIDRWAAQSSRIRRVYQPDSGIYDAMNTGLRAAAGEYICFLNADDFLVASNTLDTAMHGLSAGAPGNPDLIVGDVAMGTPKRHGIWRRRRVPRLLRWLRGVGFFPVHQGLFAKRQLLQAVGGFDANLRLASDTNLYYDLERLFPLSMRVISVDVAFMRAGGSANAGLRAMWRGSAEIYGHLTKTHSSARSAAMVLVKTLQSLTELRYGTCPHGRWFARGADDATAVAPDR